MEFLFRGIGKHVTWHLANYHYKGFQGPKECGEQQLYMPWDQGFPYYGQFFGDEILLVKEAKIELVLSLLGTGRILLGIAKEHPFRVTLLKFCHDLVSNWVDLKLPWSRYLEKELHLMHYIDIYIILYLPPFIGRTKVYI